MTKKPGKSGVMNSAVTGKSIEADSTKEKLAESPKSKVAIQPGKQIGSDEGELASEGKRQCHHCAVVCSSTSDLATHTKFWHSNIKSGSITGSKGKAQVILQQRKVGQQNLSNFRGYRCFQCPHCPAMCDSQAQLNTHMSLCHSNTGRPVDKQALPLMRVQTGHNLKKKGSNKNHFRCDQCTFTCDLEAQFVMHMKMHQECKKFGQTLTMNQRKHQEMAYQQRVKLDVINQQKVKPDDIKQRVKLDKKGNLDDIKQKGNLDDIKQLKEMQVILSDIEEGRFGKGWGSKLGGPSSWKEQNQYGIGGPPPLKDQNQWTNEWNAVKPGEKRSFDESEGLFSRRREQTYPQVWQPKVVKDYSKEPKLVKDYSKEPKLVKDYSEEPKMKQAELSSASRNSKREDGNFESREGVVFQPKVFNYPPASIRQEPAEGGVQKPKLEEAVFGEEVCKETSEEKEVVSKETIGMKEGVSNVEMSEDHISGGHWRKRLVGLC